MMSNRVRNVIDQIRNDYNSGDEIDMRNYDISVSSLIRYDVVSVENGFGKLVPDHEISISELVDLYNQLCSYDEDGDFPFVDYADGKVMVLKNAPSKIRLK